MQWGGRGLIILLMVFWALILGRDLLRYGHDVEAIPYSQFLEQLQKKNLDEVLVGTERIEGVLKSVPDKQSKNFETARVEDRELTQKLTAAGVKFSALHESTFLRDLFSWVVPILVMAAVWWFVMSRVSRGAGGSGFLSLGKSKARVYVEKGLQTRFSDVAGIDEVKAELYEIVQFLRDPLRYSRLGGRMPKGFLLIGPPGTGKTMLARAVAGEAGVPFFSINGSEFVELFVGLGAARVRDLFAQAREHSPCIIFIDELDALGKARVLSAITGSASDEKEQTLNQLLAELDGFDPAQGIVVLAATNRPEVLDPALLRAGRFDRQVMVDKPDRNGRFEILKVHVKNISLSPTVDLNEIAGLTTGFSGADLANLTNEAAITATRRGAAAVETRDFTEAIERQIAGLERKSRLLNDAEKRRVAFHEMGHATVALALGEGQQVHKVSIIPRGVAALGYTLQRPSEDRYLLSRVELRHKLAMLLGGRASEQMFLDDISTGAADDLDKATEIARAMVTRYGMSERLGLTVFERESSALLGSQAAVRVYDYSQQTAETIDSEVKRLIDEALTAAEKVLDERRDTVENGVRHLLLHETLDEAQLKALWSRQLRDVRGECIA